MIDLTDLDARIIGHTERISRADRRGVLRPQRSTAMRVLASARRATVQGLKRRSALVLVRAGAQLLGGQTGSRLGTGRIIRQPGLLGTDIGTDFAGFDPDRPIGLGLGPDGALYLTFPAVGPNAEERPGALMRIDLAG